MNTFWWDNYKLMENSFNSTNNNYYKNMFARVRVELRKVLYQKGCGSYLLTKLECNLQYQVNLITYYDQKNVFYQSYVNRKQLRIYICIVDLGNSGIFI